MAAGDSRAGAILGATNAVVAHAKTAPGHGTTNMENSGEVTCHREYFQPDFLAFLTRRDFDTAGI
jgi:hypothetical protein